MNPKQIVDWIKFGFLVLKYGKVLVDVFMQIYDAVERWAKDRKAKNKPVPSTKKAEMFDRSVAGKLLKAKDSIPSRKELRKIRSKVWKKKNPDKEPKPINEIAFPLNVEDLEF